METPKNFEIVCRICGCKEAAIKNTQDSDAEEGVWGGMEIVCPECGVRESIADAP